MTAKLQSVAIGNGEERKMQPIKTYYAFTTASQFSTLYTLG